MKAPKRTRGRYNVTRKFNPHRAELPKRVEGWKRVGPFWVVDKRNNSQKTLDNDPE